MGNRGLHFAIDDQQLEALRAVPADHRLFDHLVEVEEMSFGTEFGAETDKAWGLIHQTLIRENPCADDLEPRDTPLSYVIMGEEALSGCDWFMVNLTTSAAVPLVQEQLGWLSRSKFEIQLRSLLQTFDCPNIEDRDVEYAGHWFEHVKRLFEAAHRHNRHVIFTVDY